MEVEVEDSLLRCGTGGSDQIHPLRFDGRLDRLANENGCTHEFRCERRLGRPKIAHMLARDDQRMTGRSWRQRKERDPERSGADDLD